MDWICPHFNNPCDYGSQCASLLAGELAEAKEQMKGVDSLALALHNLKPESCACPDLGGGKKSGACGRCIAVRTLNEAGYDTDKIRGIMRERVKAFSTS